MILTKYKFTGKEDQSIKITTKLLISITIIYASLVGCASITKGTMDNIQVSITNCTELVQCTATNKKGEWQFTAPGAVKFIKSDDPLTIVCNDGDGVVTVQVVPTRGGIGKYSSWWCYWWRGRLIYRCTLGYS